MTLQQEVYEKIMKLPEDSIRLFIVMADEIARQKGISSDSVSDKNPSSNTRSTLDEDLRRKQKAFQEMEEMRKKSPFPKNFNYEKNSKVSAVTPSEVLEILKENKH